MTPVLSQGHLSKQFRRFLQRACLQETRALATRLSAKAAFSRRIFPGPKPSGVDALVIKRSFANAAENPADGVAASTRLSKLAIEEIRLKAQFEQTNDVREYLRKWQLAHRSPMDPVRYPGAWNDASDTPPPWSGTMANDLQYYDAEAEELRANDGVIPDSMYPSDEGEGVHDFLQPGDLVALSGPDGFLTLSVYVRSVKKQQQFYTESGKWRVAFARDLDYVRKGVVDREELAQLLPYFPDELAQVSVLLQNQIEGGVPRTLGAPLLRKIRRFSEQVQEFYRANHQLLDGIHETVADDQENKEYTIKELASKALDLPETDLDDVMLFAVHQAARRVPFLIDNDRSSLFADHYLVRPRRLVKVVDTVVQWVHEHQKYLVLSSTGQQPAELNSHHLQQFLQKARRLIRVSRRVRSPTTMACLGPTAQRFQAGEEGQKFVYKSVETETFDKVDQTIIEFLRLYCIPPRRMTSGTLRTAGSYIMRATGMYNELGLSAASMPLFLQELGVFTPWDNARLLDQSLSLPGQGISTLADSRWENVRSSCQQRSPDSLTDRMRDLRTDWGDLPVYCVDDPTAEEIDDGVSLERELGTGDLFWVRVHVANPSAFLPPNDAAIEYAASRYSTLYAPERTYPMLPQELTRTHFSLAPDRPTLTFSAKMNLQGEILGTDIRSGIVRNVIYVTHDQVRSLFEPGQDRVPEALTVGGNFTSPHSRAGLRENLSPEDQDTFHTLRQLMLAFRQHRLKNGAMEWPEAPEPSVSVSAGQEAMEPCSLKVETGRYILGDPVIRLRLRRDLDPHEVPDQSKRNLVSLLMNLAGWIAGRWCADRNIPAVFDGTWYHPEYPKVDSRNISEYGGSKWLSLGAPKGVSASVAMPHVPLGLDAYVKATSPMRRYTDLLAHYQLEAALRHENETGQRFDALEHPSALPFSKNAVDTFIARSRWKRNWIRSVDSDSKQWWACLLLFRAFYFGECELPSTFPCLLHHSTLNNPLAKTSFGGGFSGVIASLGVRCQVLFPADFPPVRILSVVEAKIVAVDMSRSLVVMEATRLVKHFERVGEWS